MPEGSAPILALEELICCHLVALSQPATPAHRGGMSEQDRGEVALVKGARF